ncbi:hypothetical protein [Xanthomonas cucurbitae]|uniref:Uncharacterized protein n=1 Tax=Xanthomonas cucurbitae TaxID=56453 RepID=A0ABY7YIA4_9XANT|nr:hypothetical protein [Xanthomonas cucurbitae]WDM69619.1 hypothetical protein K6981_00370 [Xanthomonas cucurbitae]WDM73492.1 hypothetical protein K6978_00365 [Xanthomonas cucurbitae]
MATAIPYRSDAVFNAATLGPALLWTGVLLAAFIGLIVFMQKKGLIARWQRRLRSRNVLGSAIVSRGEYRISRATVIHVVEIDGRQMVITESRGAQVSIERLAPSTGNTQ